jgi:hypothetical protein
MGLEGRKVSEDRVMFGEPLNEKALKALQARSPTADSIINSLPKSAFIPIQQPKVVTKEKVETFEKTNKAEERKAKKRLKKIKRKSVEKKEDNITISKIIEDFSEKTETIKESPEVKMDLEKELEALSMQAKSKEQEMVQEVNVEQEATPQTDLRDQIISLLSGEENAPNEEMISVWKETYGKSGIHVMAFGEGEVYIYHHLTRGEWKKLKELMAKLQEASNADDIEEQLKEKVVLHCVLWPALNDSWLNKCKAGVIDSLYQMILLNSGFLTPQQAMLLTTPL